MCHSAYFQCTLTLTLLLHLSVALFFTFLGVVLCVSMLNEIIESGPPRFVVLMNNIIVF